MRTLWGWVAVAALSSCASSSGVLPTGRDSFTLRKEQGHGFTGGGELRAAAFREADGHCKAMGKELLLVRRQESRPPYVLGNYPMVELDFQCLAATDPAFTRARMGKEADTVIELRR
jgi:hypothetical protein